jgi:DNA-binding NtrC family response regulator
VSRSGNTTTDDPIEEVRPPQIAVQQMTALVMIQSRYEPWRTAEVALIQDDGHSGFILGRPDDVGNTTAPNLLCFGQQQPGRFVSGGPLAGRNISRRELHMQAVEGGLEIEHLGKASLLINGVLSTSRSVLRIEVGTILALKDHSMYMVVKRPSVLTGCEPDPHHVFGEPDVDLVVGESPGAWAMRTFQRRAVLDGGHVFLFGQSGTGKELMARAIHRLSGRSGEFLAFNAANLVPSLADNILLGNRAGYPNPGMPFNPGLISQCEGGTLFLDEFAWSDPKVQAGLLRALEGELVRQGESTVRRCDVLFVCATNRDSSMVNHDVLKRFANVFHVPPLIDRLEDIPLLARHIVLTRARENPVLAGPFVTRDARGRSQVDFAPAMFLKLLRLPYDGNVRDLRNLLGDAMKEHREPPLMYPEDLSRYRPAPSLPPPTVMRPGTEETVGNLRSVASDTTSEQIVAQLEADGWNVTRAAEHLDMTRSKLIRLMEKYGIRRPGTGAGSE